MMNTNTVITLKSFLFEEQECFQGFKLFESVDDFISVANTLNDSGNMSTINRYRDPRLKKEILSLVLSGSKNYIFNSFREGIKVVCLTRLKELGYEGMEETLDYIFEFHNTTYQKK